jgi:hypothetical protein
MNSVWYGKKPFLSVKLSSKRKCTTEDKPRDRRGCERRRRFLFLQVFLKSSMGKKWLISFPFIFDLQHDDYRLSRFWLIGHLVFPFPSFLSSFPFWNFISTIYHSHCLRWKDSHIGFQDATLPDSFFSHRVWQKWLFLTEPNFSNPAHLLVSHKSGTMRTLWRFNPDHWLSLALFLCQW